MAESGGGQSWVTVPAPAPPTKGHITTTNYIQSCYMLQMGWDDIFCEGFSS